MSTVSVNVTQNPIVDIATICGLPTTVESLAQGIFLIIIAIVTVLGNSAICCAILWNRMLHRYTNYLVVSLAVSDLMVAVFSLPFRIHQTLHNTAWCLGTNTCIFWIWIDLLCRCAAFANLALIALDRFLATIFPQKYHRIITTNSGTFLLLFVWLDALVISSLGLTNWTLPNLSLVGLTNFGCSKTYDPYFYTFAAVVGFFLPLYIIGISYTYVLVAALSHWKATSKAIHPTPPPIADGNKASNRLALGREIKAAQTLAIVIVSFVICWLPFFIILMVVYWCPSCLSQLNMPINVTFIYVLPNITSALNPIIFFLFSRKLREAFVKFCSSVTKMINRYQ